MTYTRRNFLGLTAGGVFAAGQALSQDATSLILRERIAGEPRYVRYASRGNYLLPSSPLVYSSEVSRVYIFYPLGVKRSQIIIFSHGALADPATYRELLWHWASHGYIVLAPLHDDAVILNGPALRKRTDDQLSEWPVPSLLEDQNAWQKRILACRSILDLAKPLTKALNIDVDLTRPIIAGHGYGSFIANLLMGAEVVTKDQKRLQFADHRFFASISLSPQGPGVMGLTDESWKRISGPMISLVSENELDFTGQPWTAKAKSFELAKPGYKHFGLLTKGTANSFSGQMTGGNLHEGKLFEGMRAYTTAFIKAYGEYDPISFSDMTTNMFERNTLGAIKEKRR